MKTGKIDPFMGDVATVMAMRLSSLPMLWLLDPAKAERETRKMFSEKEDAYVAACRQMTLAPMYFWMDAWQGVLQGERDGGLSHAFRRSQERVSQPYRSRVSANKRRLSGG